MKGSGPCYGESSLNNRNSHGFLLWHHVLLRSLGNPFKRVQSSRRQGGVAVFERENPIILLDFPPLRLEPGLKLGSCAKGWEVCGSFIQKFPSGARCSAGQSGFQAALGGGLVRQFFCLPFPGIFSEWGGNSFAF